MEKARANKSNKCFGQGCRIVRLSERKEAAITQQATSNPSGQRTTAHRVRS